MRNLSKSGLISALALVLLALSITLVRAGDPAVKETVLQVANLSCGSCVKHIESELRKHKGMVGLDADLIAGRITIKHTGELSPDKLAELVSGVGYPAKVAAADKGQEASAGTPCKSCNKGCKTAPAPDKK